MFRTEQDGLRERVAGEIRAAMARKRISATTLSQQVAIPPATLSRKLNAKTGFTVDELLEIADALSVDASELLRLARAAA
jgi:DNA-binding Xre family transcriptional regulator